MDKKTHNKQMLFLSLPLYNGGSLNYCSWVYEKQIKDLDKHYILCRRILCKD